MKLNELQPKDGAKKKKLIVGRGIGSGKGKTCGSGQKGQKSRSGVAINGFEGGQMPLFQRLPKMGFNNTQFAAKLAELSLGKLQAAIDAKKIDAKKPIDEDTLVKAGVIRRKRDGVKLLASGELKAKVEIQVTKASKGAAQAIEKAGGKISFIEQKQETKEKLVKKEGKKKTTRSEKKVTKKK